MEGKVNTKVLAILAASGATPRDFASRTKAKERGARAMGENLGG